MIVQPRFSTMSQYALIYVLSCIKSIKVATQAILCWIPVEECNGRNPTIYHLNVSDFILLGCNEESETKS